MFIFPNENTFNNIQPDLKSKNSIMAIITISIQPPSLKKQDLGIAPQLVRRQKLKMVL
jgi:hypothetical protein